MINVNVLTDQNSKQLTYVLDFLNKHPANKGEIHYSLNQNNSEGISIYYSNEKNGEKGFLVKPQNLVFQSKEKRNLQSLCANSFSFKSQVIFSVEKESREPNEFVQNNQILFDVFETIFFHISRVEETHLDQANFLGKKIEFEQRLFAIKNEIYKFPVVDQIIQVMNMIFTKTECKLPTLKILTHDIDHIQLFKQSSDVVKKIGGNFYHRKGLKGLNVLMKNYSSYRKEGKDPFDTFDWMLNKKVDEKRIYFLVGGKHPLDTAYDLNNRIFVNAISEARSKNYEIGIHPSFDSWNSLDLIQREKRKLEEVLGEEITMSRQHYLNFDISITPQLLLEAGIERDSSLGYTRFNGYRCGTAYAYQLYDFENQKASALIEEPLVFMDMAWMYEKVESGENHFNLEKYQGVYNFHNSFFYEAEQRGINAKRAYLEFFE